MILGVLSDSEIRSLKVGIITTRRVGNAVARSGIRRRLRGIVQRHGENLRAGHWLVMIPHAQSGGTASAALERDWLKLIQRAGMIAVQAEAGITTDPQQPEAVAET